MQYTKKGNKWRASVEVLRSDGGMIARRKSPARLIGNSALKEQTVHSTVNLDGKIIIIESRVISKQIVNNLDVVDDALPCREYPSNSANCTHLMELSTPSASRKESSSLEY